MRLLGHDAVRVRPAVFLHQLVDVRAFGLGAGPGDPGSLGAVLALHRHAPGDRAFGCRTTVP